MTLDDVGRLLIVCPDRPGIVSTVSHFLFDHGANVIHSDQHSTEHGEGIFFMTHPVFTPYYTVPIAMLSLWTLLFATLRPHRQSVADNPAFASPAKA